jgi:hypothetical protein
MRIVHEAVQNGVGISGVANDLMPSRQRELGGDDCRSSAISFLEDFEQIVTSAGVAGFEAEVVENEQIGAAERFDEARVASVASRERGVFAQLWPAMIETERLSRQAFWPMAQASQLLPTPDGPTKARLSWASIPSPSESFWNKARSTRRKAPPAGERR